MTKEAFMEVNKKLNANGLLCINFYGYINGKKGQGARSIYRTLLNDNFKVQLTATEGLEQYRNLLFIAGKNNLNPPKKDVILITENKINFSDAYILNDNQPILEHIYLKAALDWRKNYNEVNAKYFLNY